MSLWFKVTFVFVLTDAFVKGMTVLDPAVFAPTAIGICLYSIA